MMTLYQAVPRTRGTLTGHTRSCKATRLNRERLTASPLMSKMPKVYLNLYKDGDKTPATVTSDPFPWQRVIDPSV